MAASGPPGLRTAAPAEDARNLPALSGHDEVRHRDFREATPMRSASDFSDWPIKGPHTAAWWIKTIAEVASTPMGHHTKFVAHFRPGASDPIALAHESYSRLIQHMVCYDQLVITNIAAAELAIRQLQLLEERQVHSSAGGDSAAANEQNLFLGSAAGHGAIGISPEQDLDLHGNGEGGLGAQRVPQGARRMGVRAATQGQRGPQVGEGATRAAAMTSRPVGSRSSATKASQAFCLCWRGF